MSAPKNICIFSLDTLGVANFDDFLLIKTNGTYFFLRKTKLNNNFFTQSKCPISRHEHDFLIINLELIPIHLRNSLLFAEHKIDFDAFLHRLVKPPSYANITEHSKIHHAAHTGNMSLLQEIIAQEEDIDALDSNGYSPLDLALATSNFSAAKMLIDNGAKHRQSKSFPLLSMARFNFLKSNDDDLAQEIKYFPQQTFVYLSLEIRSFSNYDYALFLEAVIVSANKTLLKEYIKQIKHFKINVHNLIYFSVIHNFYNSLKFILCTNTIDLNKKRKKIKHQTLLHIACKYGYIETTKILLKHNHELECHDYNLSTPLHLACQSENIDLVLFLIKAGANINAKSSNNFTPLHFAICENNFDLVEILIRNGANIHAKTKNNLSAIYLSVNKFHYNSYQQTLIASSLLSKGCISDSDAIALAFNRKETTALSIMMKHGSITSETIDSESLIFEAINNDMLTILELLLKKTKNINRVFMSENKTALQIALYKNNFSMVDLLIRNGATISSTEKSLIQRLYEINTNGWTTLHTDALYNRPFNVRVISNKNINPNYCATKEGTTPLHIASATNNNSFIVTIKKFMRPLLPFWGNKQLKTNGKENKDNMIKSIAYKAY